MTHLKVQQVAKKYLIKQAQLSNELTKEIDQILSESDEENLNRMYQDPDPKKYLEFQHELIQDLDSVCDRLDHGFSFANSKLDTQLEQEIGTIKVNLKASLKAYFTPEELGSASYKKIDPAKLNVLFQIIDETSKKIDLLDLPSNKEIQNILEERSKQKQIQTQSPTSSIPTRKFVLTNNDLQALWLYVPNLSTNVYDDLKSTYNPIGNITINYHLKFDGSNKNNCDFKIVPKVSQLRSGAVSKEILSDMQSMLTTKYKDNVINTLFSNYNDINITIGHKAIVVGSGWLHESKNYNLGT